MQKIVEKLVKTSKEKWLHEMEIGLVRGILEGYHMFISKRDHMCFQLFHTKCLQHNDDIVITKWKKGGSRNQLFGYKLAHNNKKNIDAHTYWKEGINC
jgi:hypothetical protein